MLSKEDNELLCRVGAGTPMGNLMRENVNWFAAVLFYLIYVGGIQIFVLMPAIQADSGILRAALMGGLLGLFAYSTFDLTGLALLVGQTGVAGQGEAILVHQPVRHTP